MKRLLLCLLALLPMLGLSIDLRGVSVPAGGNVYGVTAEAGPVDLAPAFDQALGDWNSLIGDDYSLTIQYGWSRSVGSALAEYYGWWFPFGNGAHVQARVLFNPTYSWSLSAESGKFDLLSVARHEIGHAFVGVGPQWTAASAGGKVTITSPRRLAGNSYLTSGGHLADPSTLMYYGVAPGQRKSITDIDLDVAMEVKGFAKYLQPVPEPASLAVVTTGLCLLIRRKRLA